MLGVDVETMGVFAVELFLIVTIVVGKLSSSGGRGHGSTRRARRGTWWWHHGLSATADLALFPGLDTGERRRNSFIECLSCALKDCGSGAPDSLPRKYISGFPIDFEVTKAKRCRLGFVVFGFNSRPTVGQKLSTDLGDFVLV